jgi:hypothetical protein
MNVRSDLTRPNVEFRLRTIMADVTRTLANS